MAIEHPEDAFYKKELLSFNGYAERIRNMNGSSISRLTNEDLAKLIPIIRPTMKKLGYELLQ